MLLDPTTENLKAYASVHFLAGDYLLAADAADRLLSKDPTSLDAITLKVRSLAELGQVKEALLIVLDHMRQMRSSPNVDKKELIVACQLAFYLILDHVRPGPAFSFIDKMSSPRSCPPSFKYMRAVALYRCGRNLDALRELVSLRDNHPHHTLDPTFPKLLAEVQVQNGELKEAYNTLYEWLEANRGSPDANRHFAAFALTTVIEEEFCDADYVLQAARQYETLADAVNRMDSLRLVGTLEARVGDSNIAKSKLRAAIALCEDDDAATLKKIRAELDSLEN